MTEQKEGPATGTTQPRPATQQHDASVPANGAQVFEHVRTMQLTPEQRMRLVTEHAKTGRMSAQDFEAALAGIAAQAQAAPPTAPGGPPAAPQAQAAPEALPGGPAAPTGPAAEPVAEPRALRRYAPGNLGTLIDYLYDASLYPCPEVATVAGLGLVAGIVGRAYTTPGRQTGLNVYFALVGRSGSGKEALHEGPQALMAQVRRRQPAATVFVNFHDYASGPALTKAAAEGVRCFVTFSAELGKLLARMGNERDANAQGVRTALTRLYSKSGPDSVAGDMRYSDKDKHVVIDGSVALSLVGESTPGTAMQALTDSMAEDGLLSRFQFVPMPDTDPDYNYEPTTAAPQALVEGLASLATQALTLLSRGTVQQVQFADVDTEDSMDAYRMAHRDMMGQARTELERAVHNRAHLKALKYACLMAVVDDPLNPRITERMVEWACMLADRGVQYMQARAQAGDIGSGDDARERHIARLVRKWIEDRGAADMTTCPADMVLAGLVPRKYLQKRTSCLPAFRTHYLGATAALDLTLRSMCDSGYLVEADRAKVGERYGYQGKCFRVLDLP